MDLKRLGFLLVLLLLLTQACTRSPKTPTPPTATSAQSTPSPTPSATATATPTASPVASASAVASASPVASASAVASAKPVASPEAVASASAVSPVSEGPAEPTATTTPAKTSIVVSSKPFTEQLLLGRLLLLWLEEEKGYEVVDETGFGTTQDLRDALESGKIDIYWEYTGTALSNIHGFGPTDITDPQVVLDTLRRIDDSKGFKWLEPASFDSAYVLIAPPSTIEKGIETISDLADSLKQNPEGLQICLEEAFWRHADGRVGLQEHYGLEFQLETNASIESINTVYELLGSGQCDVGATLRTDTRIRAGDYYILEDTKAFFSPNYAVPVVRTSLLAQHPNLEQDLNELLEYLVPNLSDVKMSQLNACVDLHDQSVRKVAKAFLEPDTTLDCLPSKITVGSTDDPEQILLAKIVVLALEDAGFDVDDKSGQIETPREAVRNDEIDLYWEFTGAAFAARDTDDLPNRDDAYQRAKGPDERELSVVWLERANFDNTYGLIVRDDLFVEKQIRTLDALAEYMKQNDAPLRLCFQEGKQQALFDIQDKYGFGFRDDNISPPMPADDVYQALHRDACDVALGPTTDGRISLWGLNQLKDTAGVIPANVGALVIQEALLREYRALQKGQPLEEMLPEVAKKLDNATLSALNARLLGADGTPNSGDEDDAATVARHFLDEILITDPPKIRVGVRLEASTEQQILREILLLTLQTAGYDVEKREIPGESHAIRDKIKSDKIDLYWEFTDAVFAFDYKNEGFTDPEEAFERLKRSDESLLNLIWLEPSAFNNPLALIGNATLKEKEITTIQELAKEIESQERGAPTIKICVDHEFSNRAAGGLSALQERYRLDFDESAILIRSPDEIYKSLRDDRCQVAQGSSLDGHLDAAEFYKLEDRFNFFKANVAAPVIRGPILGQQFELRALLAEIGPRLDNRTMSRFNACVDVGLDGVPGNDDDEDAQAVARAFLQGERVECLRQIVVGSGETIEHIWAAKLLLLLLAEKGHIVVDKSALGNSQEARQALLEHDIDVYWELIGKALTIDRGLAYDAVPLDSQRAFALIKDLDKESDLAWLKPLNSNTTYALAVQEDSTIKTIAELADFINNNPETNSPLFKICLEEEFANLPYGLPGLQKHYGFEFKKTTRVEKGTAYQKLGSEEEECGVAQGLTTDDPEALGLMELTDTQNFFIPLASAHVIRQDVLDEYQNISDLLELVNRYLDQSGLAKLYLALETMPDPETEDNQQPIDDLIEKIARSTLCEDDLLSDCPGEPEEQDDDPDDPDDVTSSICEDLVQNGDFERDQKWVFAPTRQPGGYTTEVAGQADSSQRTARLGGNGNNRDLESESNAYQKLDIPPDAQSAFLTYSYYAISEDRNGGDSQGSIIYNSDLTQDLRSLWRDYFSDQQSWQQKEHDLSDFIGQSISLYFYVNNDGDGQPSAMYLDDVSLKVCYEQEANQQPVASSQ